MVGMTVKIVAGAASFNPDNAQFAKVLAIHDGRLWVQSCGRPEVLDTVLCNQICGLQFEDPGVPGTITMAFTVNAYTRTG